MHVVGSLSGARQRPAAGGAGARLGVVFIG
jgi:hypothetical protein